MRRGTGPSGPACRRRTSRGAGSRRWGPPPPPQGRDARVGTEGRCARAAGPLPARPRRPGGAAQGARPAVRESFLEEDLDAREGARGVAPPRAPREEDVLGAEGLVADPAP